VIGGVDSLGLTSLAEGTAWLVYLDDFDLSLDDARVFPAGYIRFAGWFRTSIRSSSFSDTAGCGPGNRDVAGGGRS
jgi:hypothetical protein